MKNMKGTKSEEDQWMVQNHVFRTYDIVYRLPPHAQSVKFEDVDGRFLKELRQGHVAQPGSSYRTQVVFGSSSQSNVSYRCQPGKKPASIRSSPSRSPAAPSGSSSPKQHKPTSSSSSSVSSSSELHPHVRPRPRNYKTARDRPSELPGRTKSNHPLDDLQVVTTTSQTSGLPARKAV